MKEIYYVVCTTKAYTALNPRYKEGFTIATLNLLPSGMYSIKDVIYSDQDNVEFLRGTFMPSIYNKNIIIDDDGREVITKLFTEWRLN